MIWKPKTDALKADRGLGYLWTYGACSLFAECHLMPPVTQVTQVEHALKMTC